jgi:hypothetical protein
LIRAENWKLREPYLGAMAPGLPKWRLGPVTSQIGRGVTQLLWLSRMHLWLTKYCTLSTTACCEILVDTQWTDRGGGRKNVKKLTNLLRCLKEARAEYEKLK